MTYVPEKHTNAESGRSFERKVSQVFRDFGWDVVETPASNDFGADIIAEFETHKLAIQCKFYSGYIGRSAIQEVLYAKLHYHATRTIVIFEGNLSQVTRAEGTRHGVEFIRLSELLPNHELDVSEQAKRNRVAIAEELNRQLELAGQEKLRKEQEIALKAEAELKVVNKKVIDLFENYPALLQEATAFNDELTRTRFNRNLKKFEASLNLLDLLVLGFLAWPALCFNVVVALSFTINWPEPRSEIGDIGELLWINAIAFGFLLPKYLKAFTGRDDYKELPQCPSEDEYKRAKLQLSRPANSYEVTNKYQSSAVESLNKLKVKSSVAAKKETNRSSAATILQLQIEESSLEPSANSKRYITASKDHFVAVLPTVIKSRTFICAECSSSLTVKTPDASRFRCPKCKTIANVPAGLWG